MQTRCAQCGWTVELEGTPPATCPHCGQAAVDPAAPTLHLGETVAAKAAHAAVERAAADRIGPYRLVRLLGSGGMGEVHLGESADGKTVAVKVLSKECASSEAALDRFRQEGRLAGMISHPRCVFVLAADEDAGRPYIAMELMPGRTLADLLREHGPFETEEAVRLILDVIEGLEEAHRLGVIHRDVKPSNCFLEADGRLKVGDFGLSKSVSTNVRLTQSGSFLGTPLYASPEQIKGEALDARTDVYSVCATLYALLSGRAPFEGTTDAVATLARIASEPPAPLRTLRPTLSPAIERVVMRGLERDRARRWQDMEDLRAALRPLVPQEASAGTTAARMGAYLIDALFVLGPIEFAIESLCAPLAADGFPHPILGRTAYALATLGVAWLYFTLLDGLWGGSPGKRFLRLRVTLSRSMEPPGWSRAAVRTLSFVVLVWGCSTAIDLIRPSMGAGVSYFVSVAMTLGSALAIPLGLALLCIPMRKRNGYRGLHDFASGTRVVLLAPPDRGLARARGSGADALSSRAAKSEGVPSQVGAFEVKGALRWSGREGVLLAQDPTLCRSVLIEVRDAGSQGPSEARRALGRSTRLRWLASGALGDAAWNAYLAPSGRPLSEVVRGDGPLSWAETREILDQLADELALSTEDGTLPTRVAEGEVWVQPHGQVQWVDFATSREWTGEGMEAGSTDQKSLVFLYRTALLALTGRSSGLDDPRVKRYLEGRTGEAPVPVWKANLVVWPLTVVAVVLPYLLDLSHPRVRSLIGLAMGFACGVAVHSSRRKAIRAMRAPLLAPVPLHASAMLDRLPGGRSPYAGVEELRSELARTRGRPREADIRLRTMQIGLCVPLLLSFAGVPLLYGLLVFGWVRIINLQAHVKRAERVEKVLDEGSLPRAVAALPVRDADFQIQADLPDGRRVRDREAVSAVYGVPEYRSRVAEQLEADRRELRDLEASHWLLFNPWVRRDLLKEMGETDSDTDAQRTPGWRDFTLTAARALPDRTRVAEGPPADVAGGMLRVCAAIPSGLFLAECLLWALLFRGGASYRLAGLEIVGKDGLPASGLRCAMRAFFAWLPLAGAMAVVTWLELAFPSLPWLFHGVRYLGVTTAAALLVLLVVYLLLALRFPTGALHDRLARTRVVPR